MSSPVMAVLETQNFRRAVGQSVGLRLGDGRCGCGWLLALFLSVGRKQHVMVKTVPAKIPVAAEIEIDLRALRQPELRGFLWKRDRPVFDDLMLAHQTDFWHRTYQFRFDSNDLKLVGGDPGTSLQLQ
jgi:hypothetical protein